MFPKMFHNFLSIYVLFSGRSILQLEFTLLLYLCKSTLFYITTSTLFTLIIEFSRQK